MKNIKILAALFLAFGLMISCEENYEPPYDDYSNFAWYTDQGYIESDYSINIGRFITFAAVSQNELSHSWTIDESNKLLEGDFSHFSEDFTSFAVDPDSLVLSDKIINVWFPEAGVKEITLKQEFKHEVEGATEVDGIWSIEKVFTVDVYKNMTPACKIFKKDFTDPDNPVDVEVFSMAETDNPSLDNKSSWPVVNIEAGEELTFEDLSETGRPTGVKWTIPGGKPDTGNKEEQTIKFNKLGEFSPTMESIRSGAEIPKLEVTKIIPVKIQVNPSSKPFVQTGKITMDVNGIISVTVSGEIEGLVAQEDKFTVHVVNTNASFDENIAVKSAKVNSDDATVIELELDAPVFNTDEITVSFAGGNISSVDSRTLEDFDAVNVDIDAGASILVANWAGFEDEATSGNLLRAAYVKGYWVGKNNDEFLYYTRTTDILVNDSPYMKYTTLDMAKKVTLQGTDFSKPNGIPAGEYLVSYRIFLQGNNSMKAFNTLVQTPTGIAQTWDLEGLERNKWIVVSQKITLPSKLDAGIKFNFFVDPANNTGVTGRQTMYFDDLKWIPLNPRQ